MTSQMFLSSETKRDDSSIISSIRVLNTLLHSLLLLYGVPSIQFVKEKSSIPLRSSLRNQLTFPQFRCAFARCLLFPTSQPPIQSDPPPSCSTPTCCLNAHTRHSLKQILRVYKAMAMRSDQVMQKLSVVRMRGRKRECFG